MAEAKQNHYYGKSVNETLEEFHSSSSGLSESKVIENREEFGENKLYEKKKESVFQIFLKGSNRKSLVLNAFDAVIPLL